MRSAASASTGAVSLSALADFAPDSRAPKSTNSSCAVRGRARFTASDIYRVSFIIVATTLEADGRVLIIGRRAAARLQSTSQSITLRPRWGRSRDGYQVVYSIPTPRPRVSILIATTAQPDLVEPCLKSLFERTSYDNWEVVLLVSERVRQTPERDALLNGFGKRPNVRVVTPIGRSTIPGLTILVPLR